MWRETCFRVCMLLFMVMGCLWGSRTADAAEYGDTVQWQGRTIAVYDEEGDMMYQPIGDDGTLEAQALNYLLGNDRDKTLMIPEGTTIRLKRSLVVGSNTTLVATGVTFLQMKDGASLLTNQVTDADYRSLENLQIQGGIWQNRHKKKKSPVLWLVQASGVRLQDMTVTTGTQENGIRLAACKNITFSRCEIRIHSVKKKNNDAVAAVELGAAVPLLTSGLKSVINEKCVNGQTCQNVKLDKCVIHGGRGVKVSRAKSKRYRNHLHSKVILTGCTVTGVCAEAVAMENTVGFTVKNNLLITQADRRKGVHASGMLVQLYAAKGKTNRQANVVSGNVVYGIRYGILIRSKTQRRFGSTRVTHNRNHVESVRKNALQVKHCKKKLVKNNRSYVSA